MAAAASEGTAPLLAAERGEAAPASEAAAVSPLPPRRPLRQWVALGLGAGLLVASAAAFFGGGASGRQGNGVHGRSVELVAIGSGEEIRCPIVDRILSIVGHPCSKLIPAPRYFPELPVGVFGIWLSGGTFVVIEGVLLLVLELLPRLTSDFASRKICHAGSGLLFLTLDPASASARGAMYVIGVSSILMTWELTTPCGLPPFRFGKSKDVGITIYLILVMFWFFCQLPAICLAPMFFGDPAGAVVGKYISRNYPRLHKKLYDHKTVGGSLAVFLVTCATLWIFYPPLSWSILLILSVAATVAELVGGSFDNLLLSLTVIGGYYVLVGTA